MIKARIFRYDPRTDREARFDLFEVESHHSMSVLDLLFEVLQRHDPGVSFRCSCRVGMCGTCGMLINNRERLACQTKVAALGDDIEIKPLNHMPVIKDLAIDMSPFFAKYRAVEPNFRDPVDEGILELIPDRGDLLNVGDSCISCGLCVSACTMIAVDPDFVGPAALYRALTLIEDPREQRATDRLNEAVVGEHGAWPCHGHMDCIKVCPKGLPLTESIQKIKRLAATRALTGTLRDFGRRRPA